METLRQLLQSLLARLGLSKDRGRLTNVVRIQRTSSRGSAEGGSPGAGSGAPARTAGGPRPGPRPAPAAPAAGGAERYVPQRQFDLDRGDDPLEALGESEGAILYEVERRIQAGNFVLPTLPSTSVALMGMSSDPSADVHKISKLISADPMLSSELVKTANSVLYGGVRQITSIRDGVMRLGLRQLRSLVLSVSMRGIVLSGKSLTAYADEVWRQSSACARIAQALAPHVREDPEKAFLLGLLHDVGKVALLAILRGRARPDQPVSQVLVGKIFHRFHERMGAALAERWNLGEELVSVAGCHHKFRENGEFPKSAALVSIAYRVDLATSLGDHAGLQRLVDAEEWDVLEVPPDRRWPALVAAMDAASVPAEKAA